MRFIVRGIGVIFSIAMASLSLNASAQINAPTFSVIGYEGTFLKPDTPYKNGNYSLIFQSSDGNLVVYRGTTYTQANAIWSVGGSKGAKYAVLQNDGNFVLYKNLSDPSSWTWSSGTTSVPQAGVRPYIGISSYGEFGVSGYGTKFYSPKDPTLPTGTCQVATAYPVCIFPGTTSQWTSTVLACSRAEATSIAISMGAAYGACR